MRSAFSAFSRKIAFPRFLQKSAFCDHLSKKKTVLHILIFQAKNNRILLQPWSFSRKQPHSFHELKKLLWFAAYIFHIFVSNLSKCKVFPSPAVFFREYRLWVVVKLWENIQKGKVG